MATLDDIVSGAAADDEVEIDLSGAVDFEPVPDGTYPAKILKCEAGKSKEGNPKLVWTFALTEGAHAGRQLMRHTPITGKGSGLAKQVIKAAGFDTVGERVLFKPSASIGREVDLVVTRQKDNEDFNDIKRVKAPAASSASPLD